MVMLRAIVLAAIAAGLVMPCYCLEGSKKSPRNDRFHYGCDPNFSGRCDTRPKYGPGFGR